MSRRRCRDGQLRLLGGGGGRFGSSSMKIRAKQAVLEEQERRRNLTTTTCDSTSREEEDTEMIAQIYKGYNLTSVSQAIRIAKSDEMFARKYLS